MKSIDYHTNKYITSTTKLTHAECHTIRLSAYKCGLRAGILITIIATALIIGFLSLIQ